MTPRRLFDLTYLIGVPVAAGCLLVVPAAGGGQETHPGQETVPAPTPPLGWNSWDSHGLRINEQ